MPPNSPATYVATACHGLRAGIVAAGGAKKAAKTDLPARLLVVMSFIPSAVVKVYFFGTVTRKSNEGAERQQA